MTRRTYIDEIEDPVTGHRHRIEAESEEELDALTSRHLELLDPELLAPEDAVAPDPPTTAR